MNRISSIILAAVVLSALQGCSLLSLNGSRGVTATAVEPKQEQAGGERTAAPRKKKGKKRNAGPVKTNEMSPRQFAESQIKLSEQVLAGRWTVYEVDGGRVYGSDEEWPYLDFAVNENRFYGSNGCNVINGAFEVNTGQQISFSGMISSRMYCPDVEYAAGMTDAMNNVRSYSLSQRGNEYFLNLHNSRHITVLTLRKHNMDFINGPWQVMEIEGERCGSPDVKMVIDIPEGRIHGQTGCNILNGSLSEDPEKPHSIQFHDIATTRMACPEGSVETAFLIALEKVETAHAGAHDTVELLDKQDRVVLRLRRINDAR